MYKSGDVVIFKMGKDTMCVPRSGLGFKYGTQLFNTCGIIDPDYCRAQDGGQIAAKFVCRTSWKAKIAQGSAFMQGIILPFGTTEDDNAEGTRIGGFGSTDKKG